MAQRKISVGNIDKVSGEVNIAGRDIVKNIKTIHQRALTAAEEAARGRKLEVKLLAQGIGTLTQSLSTQASEGTESDSPYKGLLSYSLNEAEIFYGRNEAKKDLLNCLKQGPLTVLHAESGAGKSSLLQAGIAAQLIANGHLALHLRPHDADPVDFIKRMFLPELAQASSLAGASLREFLRQVCAVLGPKVNLYLLLDQFEEFFNLLDKNERKPFLESLADCLSDPSLKVRWVLALRAEALSKLAELETVGIAPFKNMYSLHRLSRAEAQEAIIEPARRHGIVFEPALIDHILNTLTTNGEVTPTHLQLVCTALTDDLPADQTLTLTYYIDHEGDTEGILRDYLKRQLEHLPAEEQAPAWKVLRALITVDRLRALKSYDELVEELKLSGVSREQIDLVLARLVERRLLATQPAATEAFELAHDYLVKEIELDPQEQARKAAQELLIQETRTYQRHRTLLSPERLAVIEPYRDELRFSEEAGKLFAESQRVIQAGKRRRSTLLAAISIVAVIVAITMTTLWIDAQKQAKISRAGELAAQSVALRDTDLRTSLLLGVAAFQTLDTVQTRSGLMINAQVKSELKVFLNGHTSFATSFAFSPNGKILASAHQDFTITLWDLETGEQIGQPLSGHMDDEPILAFSPDSKLLASGGAGAIFLWDVETGQPIDQLSISGSLLGITFNRDSEMLVVSHSYSDNVGVILWNASTRQPISPPLGQDISSISGAALSPNGKILALSDLDDTITLWDVETGQPLGQPLRGQPDLVHYLVFSPNSKLLASSSWGSTITLWDVETGQAIDRLLLATSGPFAGVAFNPNGKMLATASGHTIILWDLETRRPIGQPLSGQGDYLRSLAFSADGKTLASGSEDATIILWDVSTVFNTSVETQLPIGLPLSGHNDSIWSVAFSPDGKTLASGSRDGMIILRDAATGQPVGQPLMVDRGPLQSLVFSPDGSVLAACGANIIFLWDMETRQPLGQPLERHSDLIYALAFSPDGKTLASSSEDATIILWDVATGQQIGELLDRKNSPVYSLAFSPNGKILASSNEGRAVTLWDMATKQPIDQPLRGHSSAVWSVAFSPDGTTLATGSFDNTIMLWDVATRQPIGEPLHRHTSGVTSIAFSPDGKTLASGSEEYTIILWDMETRQPIGQPLRGHIEDVWSVAFSRDGKRLASGSFDGYAVLWDIDPQSWIQKACQQVRGNFIQAQWSQYFPNEQYRKICEQFPKHFSFYQEFAEKILLDSNEPQRVQKALNDLKREMEMDSPIKEPARESSKIVGELVIQEIFGEVNDDKWKEAISLLDQAEANHLPLDPLLMDTKFMFRLCLVGSLEGYAAQVLAYCEHAVDLDPEGLDPTVQYRRDLANALAGEPSSSNDINLLMDICRVGSLEGYAAQVLAYCERAVDLAPNDLDIRNNRGLARTLTGDFDGAIEDFQFYVDQGVDQGLNESFSQEQKEWIDDLKAGRNPFTPEVLEQLKDQ